MKARVKTYVSELLVMPVNKQSEICLADFQAASNIDDLHQKTLATLNSMGFNDYFFSHINKLDYHLLLSTCPEFQKIYSAYNYSEKDLFLQYVADNRRAIFMSDIYRYAFEAPHDVAWVRVNQQICHLYQQHGFHEFYCLPLAPDEDKSKLVLTIAAQDRDPVDFRALIDAYKILLYSLGESINTVVRTRFSEICPSTTALFKVNRKPLLVLSTLANDDITLAQVAEKLHLSRITINQHIAAARKSLGTKTTVGAIKKALSLGLIHYN